ELREPPGGHREPVLILPAFALEDRFDAIALLARLEIESLRPNLGVQGGEREHLVGRHHRDKGCAHAARGVAAKQVTGAERITAEQLSVAGIEGISSTG